MFGGIQRTLRLSSSLLVSPAGCPFAGGRGAGCASEASDEFLRRRVALSDAALSALWAGTYLSRTRAATFLWARERGGYPKSVGPTKGAEFSTYPCLSVSKPAAPGILPSLLLERVAPGRESATTAMRILWSVEGDDCGLAQTGLAQKAEARRQRHATRSRGEPVVRQPSTPMPTTKAGCPLAMSRDLHSDSALGLGGRCVV